MPGNAFIKFTKSGQSSVIGESQQDGHAGSDGWTEIGDWSWDVEAETSFLKGTGASVGKPVPGTLSFSHYYDTSSPVLMTNILKGTHFDTITIDMLKQTGDENGKPQIFFRLMAQNVFVSKVSSKGGEDGAVNQDVEMVFKAISMGYKMQKQSGELFDTLYQFGWDVAGMTNTAPAAIAISF